MKREALIPVVTLFFLACGGGEPIESPEVTSGGEVVEAMPAPAPEVDVFDYVMDSAFAVGIGRLDPLRQSPYWPEVTSAFLEGAPIGDGNDERLLGLAERTERAAFSLHVVDGRSELSWIFLQGDYQEGELESLLQQANPDSTEPIEELMLAGYRAFTHRDAVLVQLDSRSYLFGPAASLTAAFLENARNGHRSPLLDDSRYRVMADRVGLGSAPLALVVIATAAARSLIDGEADDLGVPPGSLQALGVHADPSAGIDAAVYATLNASGAEALARMLRSKKNDLANSFVLRAAGVSGIVESTSITVDGPDLVVHTRVDDATVRGLLDRFRTMAILAMQHEAEQSHRRVQVGAPR